MSQDKPFPDFDQYCVRVHDQSCRIPVSRQGDIYAGVQRILEKALLREEHPEMFRNVWDAETAAHLLSLPKELPR